MTINEYKDNKANLSMKLILIKKQSLLWVFIAWILILIAGLRLFGWANDTTNYYEMVVYQDELLLGTKELFFRLIIFLNALFFNSNFTFFLLIFASLGVGIKVYAFSKYSSIPMLSIALYFLSYFWLQDYIQIRAGVATGIFLLATKDLADGNSKKYFYKVFLAVMFHWSSILLIPLYFVVRYMNIKFIILLPAIGIFLYLVGFNFYFVIDYILTIGGIDRALYIMYAGYENKVNVFNLISLSYLLIYLSITIIMLINKSRFSEYEITLYKIFSIGIFIFFITSLLNAPVVAFRLFEYFNIVLLILLPSLVLKFKQKYILMVLFIIYYGAYGYFLFANVIKFN